MKAVNLYDLFAILFGWLRELLGFSGYNLKDCVMLATFILDEMVSAAGGNKLLLESITKFRKALPEILAFVNRFQKRLDETVEEKGIPQRHSASCTVIDIWIRTVRKTISWYINWYIFRWDIMPISA